MQSINGCLFAVATVSVYNVFLTCGLVSRKISTAYLVITVILCLKSFSTYSSEQLNGHFQKLNVINLPQKLYKY